MAVLVFVFSFIIGNCGRAMRAPIYNSLASIFSQGVDVVDRGGVREGSPFARMIEKDLVAV